MNASANDPQPRSRGTARVFAAGLVIGLLAIPGAALLTNRTPVADWLVSPLISADTNGHADAIVVAGAGVIGDCEPNQNGVQRVLLSVRLWKEGRAPLLVFTGGSGSTCPVSIAMARLAREIGVPAAAVHLETGSRSTRENAEFSAPLLRAHGVRRVLVVTDRLHMRRASGAFAKMGFDVERGTVPIYAGHADNVSMLRAGLREYVALAYYRSRGWIESPERAVSAPLAPGVEPIPRRDMQTVLKNPAGPIALLGASYAGGWDLGRVHDVPVVNLGVSGQQSFDMLARFERDVVSIQPRAVILWGFVNDLFRSSPQDETALTRVRESYTRMIALARQNGIEPVVAINHRPEDTH